MESSVIPIEVKDRTPNCYELSEMCNAELEICKTMTLKIELDFPVIYVTYRNYFVL